MSGIIHLVEFRERFLENERLSRDDALLLHAKYAKQVQLEWPSPLTGGQWRIRSQGWVGYLPLSGDGGLLLEPKVPLRSLFAMLEYAFDLRGFTVLAGNFSCDTLSEFFERLASVLAEKVLQRARSGLYREYRTEVETLSHLRGRIDLAALSVRSFATGVPCVYEDQTIDIEENRILAWTLHCILLSGICTEKSQVLVRRADKLLRGSVALTPFRGTQCAGRSYNRLNQDYASMHRLCRFFLDCLGPTQNTGDREMIPFLVDMASLFEVFVARWLSSHLGSGFFVRAQEFRPIGIQGNLSLNPDIVIYDAESRQARCVLDTKYKGQGQVQAADYSQVISYADALGCSHAFLIYPRILDAPFDEKPGRIRVKSCTFDLGGHLVESGQSFLQSLHSALQVPS